MNTSHHTAATEHRFSDDDAAQKWSEMYDGAAQRLESLNFRQRRDAAVAFVQQLLPPNGRVLDLGCGAAPVLSELRLRGISCTGLDLTEDMLRHARQRLRAMRLDDEDLHRGDCRHTPFPDASFDVVVCLGVISYVEHYDEVLTEIRRLLKPGGHAIVSFRNRFNPLLSDPVSMVRTVVMSLAGRFRPEPYTIGRFMDHREVQARMAAHGFRYRAFRGIGFGPFRVGRRKLFSERTSMGVSDALTRLFGASGSSLPFQWLADVSLWVHQKDAERR